MLLRYLRLSFWPHPLVLDYGWPVARSLGEILPGALVVGAVAVATAVALVRWPRWGFLGAWFFLILAPSSSILPLTDRAALYRMYLPLAAIAAAVVMCWQALWDALVRRGWLTGRGAAAIRICVGSAVAASLLAVTWVRNADFESAVSIWTDTVAKVPHNPRAHNNLGVVLAAAGRTDEAIAQYRAALAINPEDAKARNNLGLALAARGRTDEAVAQYRMALNLALRQGKQSLAEDLRRRLARYGAGGPWDSR